MCTARTLNAVLLDASDAHEYVNHVTAHDYLADQLLLSLVQLTSFFARLRMLLLWLGFWLLGWLLLLRLRLGNIQRTSTSCSDSPSWNRWSNRWYSSRWPVSQVLHIRTLTSLLSLCTHKQFRTQCQYFFFVLHDR